MDLRMNFSFEKDRQKVLHWYTLDIIRQ